MLNHIASTASSEEKSDRFFNKLLGLEKLKVKSIPAELSLQVFDMEQDFMAIDYAGQNIKFEIFITENAPVNKDRLEHVGLEMEDPTDLLDRAASMGLETRRVIKGEKILYFIKDFDGHLFEIKTK